MELSLVSLGIAFLAGAMSFFSPCLLPLVPMYLGYIAGTKASPASPESPVPALGPTALFVAAFSAVFVAMGASAGLLGDVLAEHRDILQRIGGVMLILLALQVSGLVALPILSRERRLQLGTRVAGSRIAPLVLGVVFALAWTPCVGPTLGAVLVLAGSSETALQGGILLLVFSLGLGLPFVVLAAAIDHLAGPLASLRRFAPAIAIVSALILAALGFLLLTDQIRLVTTLFSLDLPF